MATSSVQQHPSPISITPLLAERIQRAQSLKVPFVLYTEREAVFGSHMADVTTKSCLIACFTLQRHADRRYESLDYIHYTNNTISSRHIIPIPREIAPEDLHILESATASNVLYSHGEYPTEFLEDHLRDYSNCLACINTTDSMMKLGRRLAAFVKDLNSDDPDQKQRVKDLKDSLKEWTRLTAECANRREALFSPNTCDKLKMHSSTPIRDMYTPFLQEPERLSSRVMRPSSRSTRQLTGPYSKPSSRPASSGPAASLHGRSSVLGEITELRVASSQMNAAGVVYGGDKRTPVETSSFIEDESVGAPVKDFVMAPSDPNSPPRNNDDGRFLHPIPRRGEDGGGLARRFQLL